MKFKVAEGLSKRTIDSYEFYLNQWMEHVGDQDVAKATASDLTNYIAWMRTEYHPGPHEDEHAESWISFS